MAIKRAAVSLEIFQQEEDERENYAKVDVFQENPLSSFVASDDVSAHHHTKGNVIESSSHETTPVTLPYIPKSNIYHKQFAREPFDSRFCANRNVLSPGRKQVSPPSITSNVYRPISTQVIENPNEGFRPMSTTVPRRFGRSWELPQPRIPHTFPPMTCVPTSAIPGPAVNNDMVQVLRQIANTLKLEYLRFDGDPMRYGAFIHNFENLLERDNPDNARKLQLLIQHCSGRAREAIESCVNLSNEDGYRAAKETLYENFGKPYIIAEVHTKKLMSLPNLKTGDGSSLLQSARHLETAQRTFTGMGPSYVADLDHMRVLRELVKKLPMHLRSKWTELSIFLNSSSKEQG